MVPGSQEFIGGRWHETAGKTIAFSNGTYTTSDPEEIEFIRSRMIAANVPQGIWELDPAVEAPSPTAELAALAVATRAEAEEILSIEQAGYQRPLVLETAEAVIARRKGGRPPTVTDAVDSSAEGTDGPVG
jgi:hypothetical protein